MFDIHKIRPVHGWREFFGEVGIIVLGILIALSAESLLQQWHWHEQADEAQKTIRNELTLNAVFAWERLAVRPCLKSQLHRLSGQLLAGGERWPGLRMPLNDRESATAELFPPAYRAPTRPFFLDGWKNALATGMVDHFDRKAVASYSVIYTASAQLNDAEASEAAAATRLVPLSSPRTLDQHDVTTFMIDLAEINRNEELIVIEAHGLLQQIRGLRLGFDKVALQRRRDAALSAQRAFRGQCVRDLPLVLD